MSASLVGSEMCIRDRGNPPPTGQELRPGWTGAPRDVGCDNAAPMLRGDCLLYTSDAADDM
eukprot:5537373-Alexandrium_andersonii.AAC.1